MLSGGFWVQPKNPTFSIDPGEQNACIFLNLVLPVLFFLTPSKCRAYIWLSGLDTYRDTALNSLFSFVFDTNA